MARLTDSDFVAASAASVMGKKKPKPKKRQTGGKPKPVPVVAVRKEELGGGMADHEIRSMARDFLDEKEHRHLWKTVQHNMPAIVHLLGSAPPSSIARLALTWIQLLEQERDSG